MGQKEKLIAKLKAKPKTFTLDDAEMLLGYLAYARLNNGRTSGSRVMFTRWLRADYAAQAASTQGVAGVSGQAVG